MVEAAGAAAVVVVLLVRLACRQRCIESHTFTNRRETVCLQAMQLRITQNGSKMGFFYYLMRLISNQGALNWHDSA